MRSQSKEELPPKYHRHLACECPPAQARCLWYLPPSYCAIWLKMLGKPKFNSWTGLAFERVCLLHSSQIRERLGIGGIITTIHSWQTSGEEKESGAQIDMLNDREDGVVNICEIKYSEGEYAIDKKTDENLRNKIDAFRQSTSTRKALHLVMITPYGLANTIYKGVVQNTITANDLFSK